MKSGFEGQIGHGLESVEPFAHCHLGKVFRGEQLSGEDHAIRVHYDSDTGVRPVIEHVLVVVFGAFPECDNALGGTSGNLAGSCDVFTDAGHLIAFACHQGATFESEVAHVFAVQTECSAMLAEVFTMGLGEAVQSCMALERRLALAVAIGVDLLEKAGGDRAIRTK